MHLVSVSCNFALISSLALLKSVRSRCDWWRCWEVSDSISAWWALIRCCSLILQCSHGTYSKIVVTEKVYRLSTPIMFEHYTYMQLTLAERWSLSWWWALLASSAPAASEGQQSQLWNQLPFPFASPAHTHESWGLPAEQISCPGAWRPEIDVTLICIVCLRFSSVATGIRKRYVN